MRKYVCAVLILLFLIGMAAGCGESDVLKDETVTVVTDSTRIPILKEGRDTTSVIIDNMVNADKWNAALEAGKEWCTISRVSGGIGDTIFIYVTANRDIELRSTFLRIEAGTLVQRFRIRQRGRD